MTTLLDHVWYKARWPAREFLCPATLYDVWPIGDGSRRLLDEWRDRLGCRFSRRWITELRGK